MYISLSHYVLNLSPIFLIMSKRSYVLLAMLDLFKFYDFSLFPIIENDISLCVLLGNCNYC